MASMTFSCSKHWGWANADITTSTCLITLTNFSCSSNSPWNYLPDQKSDITLYIYYTDIKRLYSIIYITWTMVTPNAANSLWTSSFAGVDRGVRGRVYTNVLWPDITLALTMYFPVYPVPPNIKILLISLLFSMVFLLTGYAALWTKTGVMSDDSCCFIYQTSLVEHVV